MQAEVASAELDPGGRSPDHGAGGIIRSVDCDGESDDIEGAARPASAASWGRPALTDAPDPLACFQTPSAQRVPPGPSMRRVPVRTRPAGLIRTFASAVSAVVSSCARVRPAATVTKLPPVARETSAASV